MKRFTLLLGAILAFGLITAGRAQPPNVQLAAEKKADGTIGITITGGPANGFYILLGSTGNSGGVFRGENLELDEDARNMKEGNLNALGAATFSIPWPGFAEGYYFQAIVAQNQEAIAGAGFWLSNGVGISVPLYPPEFDPSKWNFSSGASVVTQTTNNCYNYACNKPTNSFAVPGRAGGYVPSSGWVKYVLNPGPPPRFEPVATAITDSGRTFRPNDLVTCIVVVAAAEADGLTQIDCSKDCPPGTHRMALVVWPREDFHWYREDNDGTWSHKPGRTEATNKSQVTDPGEATPDTLDSLDEVKRDANSRAYTLFCGCFCASNDPSAVKKE